MDNQKTPQANNYGPEIEKLNARTALPGLIAGIIMVPIFISKASNSIHSYAHLGSIVFLFGFILMFLASFLYHNTQSGALKWKMKKLDHSSIYIMIAGSYTPFVLFFFWTDSGKFLLTSIWVVGIAGILFKYYTTGRFKYFSTLMYVLMGMSVLIVSRSFFPLLPKQVLFLIILGGGAYLSGVVFYLMKFWKYHHPIWHLFVLGGAASHGLAVFLAL